MTLVELALLADIPARQLGAIECGLLPLDADSRARLGPIFALAPESLRASDAAPAGRAARSYGRRAHALFALCAVLLSALALALPIAGRAHSPAQAAPSASESRAPSPKPARAIVPSPRTPTATIPAPTSTTTPTTTPSATPTPVFQLDADGPHGCPIALKAGHVVVTQGYGEGTHAPGPLWGALDLGVDGDGDGVADPDATRDVAVVATLGGIAHVFLNSWPGGNYVHIEDAAAGWSVAYAHLNAVAVADGQALTAGAPIGAVGSTGLATGPHLHYEVWRGSEHIDPTALLECR